MMKKDLKTRPLPLLDWMESQTAVAVVNAAVMTAIDDDDEDGFDYFDASHPVAVALRAAGLFTGTIVNPSEKSESRLLKFPVRVFWVKGGPSLRLPHPALADLPFVRRVEEITGLKAGWHEENRGTFGMGENGEWHHAVDLCTEHGWQELLATRHLTNDGTIRDAVAMRLDPNRGRVTKGHSSYLSPATAAKILAALDAPAAQAA